MNYQLLKALHIISMVAWFAGLFYIFRLFVYHVQQRGNPACTTVFEIMEYKLMYFIIHPAMTMTIGFGAWMLIQNPALLHERWLHWKFTGVLLLLAYQFFASSVRRKMARGVYPLSERACRVINEIPTVILIGVVLLAVFKP